MLNSTEALNLFECHPFIISSRPEVNGLCLSASLSIQSRHLQKSFAHNHILYLFIDEGRLAIMERQRRESRQSSLPSSLIPHLYTRPQETADDSDTASFGTILPLPASAVTNEGTASTERASSLTLPPIVPAFSATSTRDESRHSPRYSSYGSTSPAPTDHILNTRAQSPPERSDSATIARSLASLSIPPRHGYANPIYSDPIYHTPRPQTFAHGPSSTYSLSVPQDIGIHRGGWREGEAGPSSLVYPPARRRHGRSRGSSQPAERTLELDLETGESIRDNESRFKRSHRREVEGQHEGIGSTIPLDFSYGGLSEHFHATSRQVPNLGSGKSSPHLSGGTSTSPYTLQPSESASTSEASPLDTAGEAGDYFSTLRRGEKRGRDPDHGEDSSRKNQNPRKTAVACNFCRGRKLRCNGAKPSCHNCTVRKFQCEYVPVQRRRGPGKAPKGTKSKKGTNASRAQPSTTLPPIDHLSSRSTQETLPPEYLPQTSVISLDNFSFQPPDPSPHDPSPSRRRRRRNTSRSASGPEPDPDTDKRY